MHVPFCFHKCHYCDFYSFVDTRDRQGAFVDRLLAEWQAASWLNLPLQTIFVGGGTPTLLEPRLWQRVLDALEGRLADDVEFTVEANPETVTAELAAVLAAGGVNRASVGAQTFEPRHLAMLERHHEPARVGEAMAVLREAGIAELNLDLIFGIPGQTADEWRRDLETAVALEPDHLSCYGLMYEPNTPLTARMRAGEFARVDEGVEAVMYETTCEMLHAAGYEQYEISNWCRPGKACRHNLVYWRNGNWWPLGPAAAGHVEGLRFRNVPRLGDWMEHGPLPPVVDVERLDASGRAGEVLMLGLRLNAGIDEKELERLLAIEPRGAERRAAIERSEAQGLLERADGAVRLTARGRLLADAVIRDLL